MRLVFDYRWSLAGALVAGLLMFGLWPAAPPRPVTDRFTRPAPFTTIPPDAGRAPAEGRTRTLPGTAVPAGEEARVRAALARDPADIDAHLDLARVHLARREMRAVWDETVYVLARSPGDPRALTYQALVRFAGGETDRAVGMLERVVGAAPELEEARRALVYVYRRTGREDAAAATAAKASAALTSGDRP